MNLVPGTLYFISETDVLDGQSSSYYKIGLVKDSRQGDELDRAGEHQTGNPRRLSVKETIDCESISDLETAMHDHFAPKRILGEWFFLNDEELRLAVAMAQNLASLQATNLERLRLAKELASVSSSDVVIQADDAAKHLFEDCLQAQAEIKSIGAAETMIKALYKDLIGGSHDVSPYATTGQRSSWKLDKDQLETEHPDIFEQFTSSEMKLKGSFRLATSKDLEVEVRRELSELITELTGRIDDARKNSTSDLLQDVHLLYLQTLKFQSEAEWKLEFATAALKSLCGDAKGIEKVATWNRSMKAETKFDQSGFKNTFPDLFTQYNKNVVSKTFAINPMRSY
jgi:hypothetical protein